jgi:pyruvate dehydrogenase E2 component (dihydrolipoamide acetyltransferase)
MQEEGYLAKILYPAGAKDVALGSLIAIIVDKKEDVAAFKDYDPLTSTKTTQAVEPKPVAAETVASAPSKSYQDHVVLEMPNLSPTMEKVRNYY